MYYVYIIKSFANSSRIYVGYTEDLKQRIQRHNAGGSPHTAQFRPWKLLVYIGFEDEVQAKDFEKYLKSTSGRAFMARRLVPDKTF